MAHGQFRAGVRGIAHGVPRCCKAQVSRRLPWESLCVLVAIAGLNLAPLKIFENCLLGLCFQLRGHRVPETKVVLVEIDDPTVSRLQNKELASISPGLLMNDFYAEVQRGSSLRGAQRTARRRLIQKAAPFILIGEPAAAKR
jgi:hypothetical protein